MPFAPLFGHASLRERLATQSARGALPPSMLLHGPLGVGKQRLALWLAQQMLCERTPVAPCGECQPCRYVLDGVHPDVHWFFPLPHVKDSSDIALEEVAEVCAEAIAERAEAGGLYARPDGSNGIFLYVTRLLVQQAVKTPAMAARKVFVVGDAERMVSQLASPEAANAFLKLLEEPPADTTIILTSSEPGSLLPTIRSRVVAVRVAPLADADVRAFVSHPDVAAALHKRGAPDDTATLVRLAHGAPGSLLNTTGHGATLQRARDMLQAADAGRDRALRSAFGQSTHKARGGFSDVLDALTVLLHERTRDAVHAGDEPRARAAARAIGAVEVAKRAAESNLNPQLVAERLLREFAEMGA